MAGTTNNGRGGGGKKKPVVDQYMESLKEACPPHKRKELDALVKKHGGDDEKIRQAIQEWWEEPHTPVEEEWADVNKKTAKKKQSSQTFGRGGGGRGPGGRGPPRDRPGRGGGGGRGAGADRAGRRSGGRGGRGRGSEGRSSFDKPLQDETTTAPPQENTVGEPEKPISVPHGLPAAVAPAALQGAWGQKAAAAAPPLPPMPVQHMETAHVAPPPPSPVPEPPQERSVEPSAPTPVPTPPKPTVRPSGNVWATKGSAHLIKAETAPRPPPSPVRPQPTIRAPIPPTPPPLPPQPEETLVPVPSPSPVPVPIPPPNALESGLSASVNGANINAAGWKPAAETTQLDSLGSTMTQSIAKEPPVPLPKPGPTTTVSKPPPTNVLNMGHWETGDNDETLDFGFGSFGVDNDTPSVGETTMSSARSVEAKEVPNAPPAASPARPPPGLSIGANSLPAGAVLVSDLESKLEGTSIGQTNSVPPQAQSVQNPMVAVPHGVAPPSAAPILPQGGGMPQNYNNAYGMGMYNYNAPGNGFVAGMHGGPVLAGGIPPKPQGGIAGAPTSGGAPPHLPQGGLYGTPTPAVTGNDSADAASGMPPGVPNMAYNPALFYGQQPYQMGQPHGVGGYGYGYGAQFGGAVQGGFGYQQGMMGQSAGYGYDDQQQGNTGGYQKNNSGGYRGRGGGNQYQNQYNPQGGYGGQPYGMGYNVDHFNQRGGYGPGGMDPYGGMQQGGSNFGQNFQSNDDDHHNKGGKKGGRNNGFQGHPQQPGGQPSFGLQGGDSNSNSNNNNGGWSNQAGGWGGAAPSWQQGS